MNADKPHNGPPMKETMPRIMDFVANGRFWGCAGVVFICTIGMPFKSGMVKDFEQYGHNLHKQNQPFEWIAFGKRKSHHRHCIRHLEHYPISDNVRNSSASP